jgi:cholesterol oxidase
VYAGVMERIKGVGIDVNVGAGVGGGSLIYNAVLYQPTKELFERVFPSWLPYEELASIHYPRVRSVIGAAPLPEDVLATDYYQSARVFLDQAAAAGLPAHLVDLGLDWDVVRQEIAGTKPPSAIAGACWYGKNSGAQRSVDRNYLAQAEQTGKVEILPLHVVTEISEAGEGFYQVAVNEIDDTGHVLRGKRFLTAHLFLAAGSPATPSLLVKAKAKGMLPRLPDSIGTKWGANGDSFGIRAGLPSTAPGGHLGGPASVVVEHFDNQLGPITLENLPLPQAHLPDGTLVTIGMGLHPPKGTLTYDAASDSARLTWPADDPEVVRVADATRATYDLLNAKNTTDPANPPTTIMFDTSLSAHPVGGVPLGEACSEFGEVRGYDGLYVVDGSLVPGGSTACTNPALTIAALAERCMDTIVQKVASVPIPPARVPRA